MSMWLHLYTMDYLENIDLDNLQEHNQILQYRQQGRDLIDQSPLAWPYRLDRIQRGYIAKSHIVGNIGWIHNRSSKNCAHTLDHC